jgi:LmbE family N-acetylglucosaminyl deacetylase
MQTQKVVLEKDRPGQPHKGRVFVAIHAHLRDVPYYAGGLCAKLIHEGYTGYLVRTTNDEKYGGRTIAQNILSNEQEHGKMAAALGFKDVVDLYYRAHRMRGISPVEIHGRIVLLLRMFKADTVISFAPGNEDPDHDVTGRAVDEACTLAASETDFPEHLEAGFAARTIAERYYFHTRPEQPYNREVEIGSHLEKKIDAIVECRSQGGGGEGADLRARLAGQGKRLPLLGADDAAANRAYVRQFLIENPRVERFYYVDHRPPVKTKVEEYVEKNAVGL